MLKAHCFRTSFSQFTPLITAGVFVLVVHVSRSAEPPESSASGVVVSAESEPESLTSPSEQQAAEQKKEVPGAFTLRNTKEMKLGRASNFDDLLQRTPGVFFQTDNGTEMTRISIRGSGIQSEDEPLGVQFMLDGLTLNQADGEAILEDFDLATIEYAEVFRGADALRYGSITLGGAINLVTATGYDADPFYVRLEGGSFGYFRGQITSGGVSGPVDYIASVMGRVRDGFRDHSEENTERFFSDFGYKFNENLENRFYLTLDRTDRQLPGSLTKEQLNEDPQQANEDAVEQDFNKNWTFMRLADKLSYRSEGYQFDAGLFWFHRDMDEVGFFSPEFAEGITQFYSDNYGLSLNFISRSELFGRRNIFTIGLTFQLEREATQNYQNLGGHPGATTARNVGISINTPFYAENQHYLTDKLSFLSGIQLIYARRHFEDEFDSPFVGNQTHTQDFFGWNPKTGLLYEVNRQTQLFVNFSGSWQPPSFDNMVDFTEGPSSAEVYSPLQPQQALTVEIGTRGERGRFQWELSLYRSWLHNELLELNDAQGNDLGDVNVNRSYHQGIEAGLDIELLRPVFSQKKLKALEGSLRLSQSYTLNDFHFNDDRVYGDNRIAGIPIHVYEAELLYQAANGFYAGPNLRCNLSNYPVDEANSLFADPYTLFGFKVGYRSRTGLSVFFEAKNLTDERFASAVDAIADARTDNESPEVFHPGDGRSFYGGVSWNW
ncbi:MAG TPA: TonB-dependent receptor [Candidatus Udaeobacter sp.]|nr:TonB-dependent receptor [Candidatus Udaeobacter sp.]